MADTATPPLTASVHCLSEQVHIVSTPELVVAEDTVKGARHDDTPKVGGMRLGLTQIGEGFAFSWFTGRGEYDSGSENVSALMDNNKP